MQQIKGTHYILMADIVGSSQKGGAQLMEQFQQVVKSVNEQYRNSLLSPLTITLGDEYQGIALSLEDSLKLLIAVEEGIVKQGAAFKLRHVLHQGPIDTPINTEIAYEMLGAGLTRAREKLSELKNRKGERFWLETDSTRANEQLNRLFLLYQSVLDDWSQQEFTIVKAFWELQDYKAVAERLHKTPSLLWKRQRSLKLKEYLAVKELLFLSLPSSL